MSLLSYQDAIPLNHFRFSLSKGCKLICESFCETGDCCSFLPVAHVLCRSMAQNRILE